MLLHFIVTCLIALITLIKEKENVSKQCLWKIWIPLDYTWFNSDSLQYHLCFWCFCSRSDQQLSSHTGQYSRERSKGMARAIQTKNDERPAGSVKLLVTYMYIYIITTRTWSYDLEHVSLPVANHQIKGDVKRKIWSDDARLAQQDMVQLMVFSSQKPFYRNMFKMM